MTAKISEKNTTIFVKEQTVEGTPVAAASADAIAVLEFTDNITRETSADTYLGDSTSRKEVTTLKDKSATVVATGYLSVLGTLNPALSEDNVPLRQLYRCCGGKVAVNDTTGVVTIGNDQVENTLVTVEFRKSSPEFSNQAKEKLQVFPDVRGSMDLSLEAGTRLKAAFNLFGNFQNPSMEDSLVANIGSQIVDASPVMELSTMQFSRIKEILGTQIPVNILSISGSGTVVTVTTDGAHGYSSNQTVKIAGTTNYNEENKIITVTAADTFTYASTKTGTTSTGTATLTHGAFKSFCINNFAAPNYFGYAYTRYKFSCQEGYSKYSVPTDVTVGMLEDEVGGVDFDPNPNAEKFFNVTFGWGISAGKNIALLMDNLQLANFSAQGISGYRGYNVSFRNTGNSFITLS